MESPPSGPLGEELQQVTESLRTALAEACGAKLERADTGELIRVEEVLAIAGAAAKRAVSIRRRRRRDKGTAMESVGRSERLSHAEPADGGATHRGFVDATGQRWDAFAVHPSEAVSNRARLPDPYRSGWLSFASGDERRRLSPVPEGWEALSDEGLRELCARADPVPRRMPPLKS